MKQPGCSLDSGLPYLIRGMYHLNCPPPLKSVAKARQCFHKALQVRRGREERGRRRGLHGTLRAHRSELSMHTDGT